MDPRLGSIFARRSVRKYTDKKVDEADVRALLEAGAAAPSANNSKPWHFIAVTERKTLNALADLLPYGKMLFQAPLAMAVCADPSLSPRYWQQDCSAATENILLAASMLGLGAVWLGIYPREDRLSGCRTLLGVPDSIETLSLIAIGHPAERPEPRTQLEDSRVHRERW